MNDFKQYPVLATAAKSVALVAGLLALVVSVLLISDHVRLLQMDPLNDPVLLELRDELAQSTGDPVTVVEQIRTYDLYARRAFFSNQSQRWLGGLLLLGSAMICFVALKFSKVWNPKRPEVGKTSADDSAELNAMFRQLMAGVGIFLLVISLFFAFAVQSDLTVLLGQPEELVPSVTVGQASLPAQTDVLSSNWPSFRGPGGIGVAPVGSEAPIAWNVESGEGVLWKAEIPVHGYNSPIVWDDRVFLSGADDEGHEVFCFDANTGEMLWTQAVETEEALPEVSSDTGLAAPTMATDGQRVFVIFATGDLAAFDFEGNPVWQKNLGIPDNPYGMGSSLISDGERLFVQYDHNENQLVMALECATGELVWETARSHISWSSPSLIETVNGRRLILCDEEHVTAYDPVTGASFWQVACLGGEVAPSPAFNGKDILFVANEYAQATAFRLIGGEPEILWQYDDYLPEISSPVGTETLFFLATTAGDVVCLDAETGDVKWEQVFDNAFSSSPVLVGVRIYLVDTEGLVFIFEAADEYREIAALDMGKMVFATPAFVNNRIYIRTDYDLYCIGD